MWYAFNVKRLGSCGDRLFLSRGNNHHQILRGLSEQTCQRLVASFYADGAIHSDQITGHELAALEGNGLVTAAAADRPRRVHPSHRIVQWFRRLSFLGSSPTLAIMALASVAEMAFMTWHQPVMPLASLSILELIAHLDTLVVAMPILAASMLVHELGHALAIVHQTGTVGQLRLRMLSGFPAITVDVSSLALTDRPERIAVWLAGAIYQLVFSTTLLALFPEHKGIVLGTMAGAATAILTLWPFPGTDGLRILETLHRRPIRLGLHSQCVWDRGFTLLVLSTMLLWLVPIGRIVRVAWFDDTKVIQTDPHHFLIVWFVIAIVLWLSGTYGILRACLTTEAHESESSNTVAPNKGVCP